jgi:hypothetical protein
LKDKINELESNSKNKNIRDLYRGINEFKKGYQPRINLVKEEKSDLLADPQKIVNRWMNYFCQLLNYRPISLLSLFKKMEKLMYNRLIASVVRNGALTGSKNGFKKKSTETAIQFFLESMQEAIEKKLNPTIFFI